MAQKRNKFSPEFKDEAVRMVIEQSRPVAQVARELGLVAWKAAAFFAQAYR